MIRILLVMIAALLALVVGLVGTVLHRVDNNTWPASIARGALAFAGTLTLGLGVLAAIGSLN